MALKFAHHALHPLPFHRGHLAVWALLALVAVPLLWSLRGAVLGVIAAELAYGEGLQAHARAAEMRPK